jgi:hypothetical protein
MAELLEKNMFIFSLSILTSSCINYQLTTQLKILLMYFIIIAENKKTLLFECVHDVLRSF